MHENSLKEINGAYLEKGKKKNAFAITSISKVSVLAGSNVELVP